MLEAIDFTDRDFFELASMSTWAAFELPAHRENNP